MKNTYAARAVLLLLLILNILLLPIYAVAIVSYAIAIILETLSIVFFTPAIAILSAISKENERTIRLADPSRILAAAKNG